MRPILLALALVLATAADSSAQWNRTIDPPGTGDPQRIARSRHYILNPAAVLSEAERRELADRGVLVTQVLTEGRYLVRVAPGIEVDSSYEPLTPEKKIHRRALRAATAGKPFADVNVLFHEDVPFEAAQAVITAAGGMLEDPLQFGFRTPTRIGARIPSTSLLQIAADERVLLVYGPMNLRRTLHNANTARTSGVDQLHKAPYGLTGDGVVLSFFEFAPADVNHREFEGRLTTHLEGTDSGNIEHATHVAGTMIAAGVYEAAKGMAPKARLHQFSASDDDFLNLKQNLRSTYGAIADNNSWGYVLGWCTSPSCTEGWVWEDTADYYGAYDVTYTAPLDKITRAAGVLMVHSAGNDANKRGPLAAPFAHKHTDDKGDVITGTFCYSENGSGTDCPAPTCSAGTQFCETKRHPQIVADLPAPYGSVGLTASAKNVIAVGAVETFVTDPPAIASFSSRGPARDGRVKPDLVARGVSVYSTKQGSPPYTAAYTNKQGTSMAAPAVTGMAALLTEQWRKTYGGHDPTPATLKTLLIAGADELGNRGPDYVYGFGLVNAKNSVDLVIADGGVGRRVKRGSLMHGGQFETALTVAAGQNVRVVLGWSDPEVVIFPSDGLATVALVNDLDVRVVAPSGETLLPWVLNRSQPDQPATRGVNVIDNTEVVEITGAAAGDYRLIVTGTKVTAQAPQDFVLVANAEMEANAVPCAELNEPNGSEATATSLSRSAAFGRTCAEGDVDFFTFSANTPGTVSVTVTATGTPLRVTLTSAATSSQTVDVEAGQSRTISVPYNSSATTPFYVRVTTNGAVGSQTDYTVLADFPFDSGPRRRSVKR